MVTRRILHLRVCICHLLDHSKSDFRLMVVSLSDVIDLLVIRKQTDFLQVPRLLTSQRQSHGKINSMDFP